MSQNCPKKSIVCSGLSKLPGVSNFSIEVHNEEFQEEVEVLDSLELNLLEFQPFKIPIGAMKHKLAPAWDVYDPTLPCCEHLGDALEFAVENTLSKCQPYPGDSDYILHHTSVNW